jgi:hypothetical protein
MNLDHISKSWGDGLPVMMMMMMSYGETKEKEGEVG